MSNYQISLPLLRLLGQCDIRIVHCESRDWPLALAAYVPAHLADELKRQFPLEAAERGPDGRYNLHLI